MDRRPTPEKDLGEAAPSRNAEAPGSEIVSGSSDAVAQAALANQEAAEQRRHEEALEQERDLTESLSDSLDKVKEGVGSLKDKAIDFFTDGPISTIGTILGGSAFGSLLDGAQEIYQFGSQFIQGGKSLFNAGKSGFQSLQEGKRALQLQRERKAKRKEIAGSSKKDLSTLLDEKRSRRESGIFKKFKKKGAGTDARKDLKKFRRTDSFQEARNLEGGAAMAPVPPQAVDTAKNIGKGATTRPGSESATSGARERSDKYDLTNGTTQSRRVRHREEKRSPGYTLLTDIKSNTEQLNTDSQSSLDTQIKENEKLRGVYTEQAVTTREQRKEIQDVWMEEKKLDRELQDERFDDLSDSIEKSSKGGSGGGSSGGGGILSGILGLGATAIGSAIFKKLGGGKVLSKLMGTRVGKIAGKFLPGWITKNADDVAKVANNATKTAAKGADEAAKAAKAASKSAGAAAKGGSKVGRALSTAGKTVKNTAKSAKNAVGKATVKGASKVGLGGAAKAGGKALSKGGAKAAGFASKTAAKKIPLIGLGVGAGLAASRASGGDYTGAGLELASGAASTIPVVGTAASLGIDAGLMVRDQIRDGEAAKKRTQKNIKQISSPLKKARKQLDVIAKQNPARADELRALFARATRAARPEAMEQEGSLQQNMLKNKQVQDALSMIDQAASKAKSGDIKKVDDGIDSGLKGPGISTEKAKAPRDKATSASSTVSKQKSKADAKKEFEKRLGGDIKKITEPRDKATLTSNEVTTDTETTPATNTKSVMGDEPALMGPPQPSKSEDRAAREIRQMSKTIERAIKGQTKETKKIRKGSESGSGKLSTADAERQAFDSLFNVPVDGMNSLMMGSEV